MKKQSSFVGVVRRTFIGSAVWLLGQTTAFACDNLFYVIWVEAEAITNIYVREVLIDASGTGDLYGIVNMPDDALGDPNPSYLYTLAVNAYMNNTKLRIFTDDTDCDISTNGENLGNILDMEAADLF